MKKYFPHFSAEELLLWGASTGLILLAFFLFDRCEYLTLTASLVGVTAILLNAKGNPAGQLLMILFSLLYGIISYTFSYYGEMITYLGMTMPMAVFSLVSWLRHPYNGKRSEVRIQRIRKKERIFMLTLTLAVTVAFYFLLRYFHTAHLLPSTISVTTSFLAVYLTFRRSPWFSLAYAANDIVLILLWALAAATDRRYLSVVVCFSAFCVNDIYGFLRWKKRELRQREESGEA